MSASESHTGPGAVDLAAPPNAGSAEQLRAWPCADPPRPSEDRAREAIERRSTGAATPARGANAPRTVLVIASRFPPVASVGATRVRKFVKYLGLFGWQPVVLTGAMRRGRPPAQDARRATDEESLLDLPDGLPVYRLSPVLDHWPGHLSRLWAARLARLTGSERWDAARWEKGLKWRLQRIHDRFAFPDREIWRLAPALRLARRLHARYRFDAIFSTGMPFSDHILALAARTLLRRPWLADFRDPWVEYIHWRQWQGEVGRRLTRAAEAAIVRRASCVISVNDHMTRRFVARYPDCPPRKFVTIPNGFDPADFAPRPPGAPGRVFRLLYAGSLYKTRSPEKVVEAFRRFIREVPGSREHARFDFMGRPGPHTEHLADAADAGPVRYLGRLPHAAAARARAEADLNVVMLPNLPGGENDTTAKIYECLGSGRPILAAVPPNGAAAEVLRPFDGVALLDPDDVAGMTRAIVDFYRRWLSGPIAVERPAPALEPLTRRHQTRRLAACLDAALARRAGAKGAAR